MEHALRGVPVTQYAAPEGVLNTGGEWFYEEYSRGAGVASLGLGDKLGTGGSAPEVQALPPTEERSRILDLFRN